MIRSKLCLIALLISSSCLSVFADDASAPNANNVGIKDRYATYSQMTNVNESPAATTNLGFKTGWYAHKKDVTYIKLIGVGQQDMGLSVLFSTTGLQCPINQYLLFKKSPKKANTYNYAVGNKCVATITTNPKQNSFVMTVNSRSKCFEEYTYQQFCNGDLDQENLDEQASTYFIGVPFIYAKDQNDSDYDYNDD